MARADSHHFLLDLLRGFVEPRRLGKVSFSGIRVRIKKDPQPKFREPDIAFMKTENAHRRTDEFWDGADLVMEIVSGDEKDRKRDYENKPGTTPRRASANTGSSILPKSAFASSCSMATSIASTAISVRGRSPAACSCPVLR